MLEENQSTILNETALNTRRKSKTQKNVLTAKTATPSPRRSGASERALRAAIEIFTRWENDEKNVPLDRIVSGEFRTRKYLNSGERRWVAEAVYGCARFWRRQVFVLEAQGRDASPENVVTAVGGTMGEEETGREGEKGQGEQGKAISPPFVAFPARSSPVSTCVSRCPFPTKWRTRWKAG